MAIQIPCLRCRGAALVDEAAPSAACSSCGAPLPPPGAAVWMVSRDGSQPYGPYMIGQLSGAVVQRQVLPSDAVWHQNAPGWVQAGQLPALVQAPFGGAAPYGYPQQQGGAPGVRSGGFDAAVIWLHIKRALKWDIRRLDVQPHESERLIANGVDDENARRYFVWRRSVLLTVTIPALISALLALINFIGADRSGLSGLGVILELLNIAALFALPVTAFLAARVWDRHKSSRRILVRGWLVAFLTPLVLALFPYAWRISTAGADAQTVTAMNSIIGLAGAISVYITLMPSVLSLIPGVVRGGVRVKALLPQSVLPGWFLIAAAPLYVLLFLVVFTALNQLVGNLVLLGAVAAFVVGPSLYVFNANTFTRPLRTPEEIAKIGRVQNAATIVILLGVALLVIYCFTANMFGKSLVGLHAETSLLRPWSTHFLQVPLDYIVRALFTMVVVADLFMLMNLAVWRQTREFDASADSGEYDRIMTEIEEAGARA